METCKPKH